MGKDKKPKSSFTPKNKEVRARSFDKDQNHNANGKLLIDFSIIDKENQEFGYKSDTFKEDCFEIIDKLSSYCTMSVHEICNANGAKRDGHGNNSHLIKVEDLCIDAQKRLVAMKLDDIDQIFSLRLNGKKRIFGILDNNILRPIWYDKNHKIVESSK